MSSSGFLERWSRRKLAEGKAPHPAPEAEHEQEQAPDEAAPVTDEPEEDSLDEAELAKLPSLDAFTVKTDLAPFLRKGVPQALKNAAMRKMWMLDPAVRDHVDFAVDYAWDWNTPGGVPGNAGAISHQSLTRMLDSLNPKPKDPATARSDAPDVASPEVEAPVASAPEAGEASGTSEPESQARVPQDSVDESAAADEPSDPGGRPRRHGGAAPV